jgi:hypothetical protein
MRSLDAIFDIAPCTLSLEFYALAWSLDFYALAWSLDVVCALVLALVLSLDVVPRCCP